MRQKRQTLEMSRCILPGSIAASNVFQQPKPRFVQIQQRSVAASFAASFALPFDPDLQPAAASVPTDNLAAPLPDRTAGAFEIFHPML